MRVKITTSHPLPKYNCWFALTDKLEQKTVHHLRKKLVSTLQLNTEPVQIRLIIDEFNLLPHSKIQDLVRDGDLVTIKLESVKALATTTIKKRKLEEESPREKKKKKVESPKEKKKDGKKAKRSSKEKNSREETKRISGKKEKKSSDKKKNKVEDGKVTKVSPPFEGSKSTKARNLRRAVLKKKLRELRHQTPNHEAAEEQPPVDTLPPPIVEQPPQVHVESLDITSTSTQLLKKNKNKKKGHLKGHKVENRSHQFFEQEPVIEKQQPASKNPYGRAFITVAESEANPRADFKGHRYQYPIHTMPTLFYADTPVSLETKATIVQQDAPVEEETVVVPVDYDTCPDADFVNNIPTVGQQLAIKTLELTASYTPEISEWKQAKLLELNLPESIVIEYEKGFGKASTKGGKFDNEKHQRRNYDYWDEQEEVEVEVEEQQEEERTVTIAVTDIFAVKNISL